MGERWRLLGSANKAPLGSRVVTSASEAMALGVIGAQERSISAHFFSFGGDQRHQTKMANVILVQPFGFMRCSLDWLDWKPSGPPVLAAAVQVARSKSQSSMVH